MHGDSRAVEAVLDTLELPSRVRRTLRLLMSPWMMPINSWCR
jgi:hypothetical protein